MPSEVDDELKGKIKQNITIASYLKVQTFECQKCIENLQTC